MMKFLNKEEIIQAYLYIKEYGIEAMQEYKNYQLEQVATWLNQSIDFLSVQVSEWEAKLDELKNSEKAKTKDGRREIYNLHKTISINNDNKHHKINVFVLLVSHLRPTNQKPVYSNFIDLLDEKYKHKEKEIIQLLNVCFTDYFHENGTCKDISKEPTKSILSTFYKKLVEKNLVVPAQGILQKENYTKIFSDTFLKGQPISSKHLIYNSIDRTTYHFELKERTLLLEIKITEIIKH